MKRQVAAMSRLRFASTQWREEYLRNQLPSLKVTVQLKLLMRFKNALAKPLWTLLAGIVLYCIPVANVCDLPRRAIKSHTVRFKLLGRNF